jgi:DNA-directed RNA polymerase subunit beta'
MEGKVDADVLGDARLNLYKSFKAVTGLGDPVKTETKSHRVKGLLSEVFGGSPKMGIVQRRLLGTPVDMAGRSVIIPNPELNMDQIGIPEDMAWKLYTPFAIRRLVRSMGNRPDARTHAIKIMSERTPAAKKVIQQEMASRPVLATRAPVLHKYGIMAFYPVMTPGKTLQTSPQVIAGFGGDYDGDAMNFHVLSSDKAIKDAQDKMLPSRNLRSPADFATMWKPRQEFLQGLYMASTRRSGRRTLPAYKSDKEVIEAFKRGDLNIDDVVTTG